MFMRQTGQTITVKAPYAVVHGAGLQVGAALFGVAAIDGNTNDIIEAEILGVGDLAKDVSVFTDGALVYWDNTAKLATSTVATNLKIGVAVLLQPDGTSVPGALTGDATVGVRLNGAF